MFLYSYKTTANNILLFLLVFYIFFSSILGSVEVYLILSVSCLLLFNGYKINYCYTLGFFPFRIYCYIIFFLVIHFYFTPFKSESFLLGTLTTLLLGIVLIQKINYDVIEKWIFVWGGVHLFFGFWNLLSFSSLYSLIHYFLPEKVLIAMQAFHVEGRNTGINSQTFPLAFYLIQTLGVLFIKYRNRINWKIFFYILMILFVLFTTSRRGALLFSFIGIFFCWGISRRYSLIKYVAIGFGLLMGIVLIIKALSGLGIDFQIFDRFDISEISFSDYNALNELSSSRLSLIINAYDFFCERPLFGQGFKFFYNTIGQDVHNTYLQFICESGIIGSIVMLSFFLFNIYKTVLFMRLQNFVDNEIIFSFYGQLFFLVMCFIENPFSDRYFFLSYIISVSFIYKRLLQDKLKSCCSN